MKIFYDPGTPLVYYETDDNSFHFPGIGGGAGVQPLDATLTALAAQNWVLNSVPVGSGADTVSQLAFAANTFGARASAGNYVAKAITDFGLSLVDDANASAGRTTLGLVIGTNVQAYDAKLAALSNSALTNYGDTGHTIVIYNDNAEFESKAVSGFIESLLDDTTAGAARTTLGLGTIATQNANAVAITGGTAALTGASSVVGGRFDIGSLTDTTPATYGGATKVAGATATTLAAVGGIDLPVADGYGVKIQAISASGAALVIGNRNASATWVERVRLDANGNVGIGVTPTTRFHVAGATSGAVHVNDTGQLYGNALHNNAGAVTGTTNQYIASGTYTPTLTNVSNIAASTAYACQWMRVGNVVTVSGRVNIDPTAAGSIILGMSLPIASAFTASNQGGGAGGSLSGTDNEPCVLQADGTNDRMQLTGIAIGTVDLGYMFSYTYLVL